MNYKEALKILEESDSLEQAAQIIAAREPEGREAVFVTGEPLHIRLTKDLTGGPDETFADIEDGNGFSVKISRIEDGNDWLIGPIYEAPKSNRPQPDKWIPCSERLPTEADEDCNGSVWVKSKLYGVKLMQRHSVRADFESHWMPTGLTRPTPPEQESE